MLRDEWVASRQNDTVRTQMHYAKKGIITEEMRYVAKAEGLQDELVRQEIERGRLIIPANVNHKNLQPMAIGIASKCKINANIGASSLSSSAAEELEKLDICLKYGADTVMDLSTGGNLDEIRTELIAHSVVPIGTVPMYQIIYECGNDIENLNIKTMLDVLEKQAKQGVSYFTIHAGFLLRFMPEVAKRKMGIVSRGGSLIAGWMIKNHTK